MFFIPVYILILFVTIIIDYAAGILIARTEGHKRKIYLVISILSTCAVLAVFKYFNFFNSNLKAVADFFHWNYSIKNLELILPIGLSFHTFQSLSYVVEVYKGNQKPEKNFGIYSLYVMFYPQLVAGPIERPQNLLHQFYEQHRFDYERVVSGLSLMLLGMFKKVVIADNFSLFVNHTFENYDKVHHLTLFLAAVFFAFQIYCDFSGYSDIALGSARVMGFTLMRNFDRPYVSQSLSEFWTRWHISLSIWFRDYVYIPLGGNRTTKLRNYFNVLVTMFLSGLWHGANWTFVIWGLMHGVFNVITRLLGQTSKRFRESIFGNKYVRILGVFIVVDIAWVFFRAPNTSVAWYYVKNMLEIPFHSFNRQELRAGQSYSQFFIPIIATTFLLFLESRFDKDDFGYWLRSKSTYIRWFLYYLMLLSILFLGYFGNQQFIYFQF